MGNEAAKYLIVESNGVDCAIVFNAILDHSVVAKGFNRVVAAGFCRLPDDYNEVSAWGESTTLENHLKMNIKSRGDVDADMILRQLLPS